MPRMLRLPRSFESMYERMTRYVDATGDCWEWIGGRAHGYGMMRFKGQRGLAHRLIYESLVGPIPDGLTLDHLCRVRHCVNPDHLEVVTMGENIRRGVGAPARNARKTHCKWGHPFSDENTYNHEGRRQCRVCGQRRRREWNERQEQANATVQTQTTQ